MWNLGSSVPKPLKSMCGQFCSATKRLWVEEVSEKRSNVSLVLVVASMFGYNQRAEEELRKLKEQLHKVDTECEILTERVLAKKRAHYAQLVEVKKLAKLTREAQ